MDRDVYSIALLVWLISTNHVPLKRAQTRACANALALLAILWIRPFGGRSWSQF